MPPTFFSVSHFVSCWKIMYPAFKLGFLIVLVISESVFSADQNETVQDEGDHDFVGGGTVGSGNSTANVSISDRNLDQKQLELKSDVYYPTDGSENQELKNVVEFNVPKNSTPTPKKLDNFRPSPQLESYYEFNRVPVVPAYPEPKSVSSSIIVGEGNSKENLRILETKHRFGKGQVVPLDKDKERAVESGGFEPGLSIARGSRNGNGEFPNVVESSSCNPCKVREGPGFADYNRETPWVSKIRFPATGTANDEADRPSYVSHTNQNANSNIHPGNSAQGAVQYSYPNENIKPNSQYLPPSGTGVKLNDYLAHHQGNTAHGIQTNNIESPRHNYGEDSVRKPYYISGYPVSNPGTGQGRFSSQGVGHTTGPNREFNFNQLVEVPNRYPSGSAKTYPHQKTFDTFYNIMERPSPEHDYKTYHEEPHHEISYNPWKKVLKLLATFVPIGLLVSALTPSIITVTNVNETDSTNTQSIRYRSNDDPKKELTNRIVSSLDYFEKLNANGCEYRVFCELLVSASQMPNAEQHVNNLLDSFSKQEIDLKSQAEILKEVFEAVRNQNCSPISCDYIKAPT
ncbi:uncharacterized protein LOC115888139 [Sitophilus oryzae]|uniref:Uncharacterized protein LOC115888139 n=1 Tax=Sitophilus oryzae TaxID=7048 RepID=A0A6J2YL46_SITOR|nr:uncharacterized protein LOC115888139 [Sitophilus oryzae]